MKSPGQLSKRAVGGVKDTVSEYKGWLILGLFAYILYKFNSVFSSLASTASAAADAATAETRAKAEAKATASKVKAEASLNKAKVSALAPGATEAQAAQYRVDAEQLAADLGTTKGGPLTARWFWSNSQGAFTLIKTKYSRLLLSNNKPWHSTKKVSQNAETPESAKRKVNHTVLQPFYSEITGGRNLVSDMKSACSSSSYQPVLKWIL